MTGVVLINMGAPESLSEVKTFLKLMFLDKHIIPAPSIIRMLLSQYISKTRFKKSWQRYELIGGTPLKKNTELLANSVQNVLGNNFIVKYAFSYSKPFINEVLNQFYEEKVNEIISIPLYPQDSITTTQSVIDDINKYKFENQKIKIFTNLHTNNIFVDFWCELIKKHIESNNITNPVLVFSAHSIPLSFIKKGDNYKQAIETSSQQIAQKLNLKYFCSYQSQMNEKKWVGPSTSSTLKILQNTENKNVIIIPISFLSENLETKYDLDCKIVPEFNNSLFNVTRVSIPEVNQNLINLICSYIVK